MGVVCVRARACVLLCVLVIVCRHCAPTRARWQYLSYTNFVAPARASGARHNFVFVECFNDLCSVSCCVALSVLNQVEVVVRTLKLVLREFQRRWMKSEQSSSEQVGIAKQALAFRLTDASLDVYFCKATDHPFLALPSNIDIKQYHPIDTLMCFPVGRY